MTLEEAQKVFAEMPNPKDAPLWKNPPSTEITFALSEFRDWLYRLDKALNSCVDKDVNSQVQPKGVTLSTCGVDQKKE
jgi:hypothetical protein